MNGKTQFSDEHLNAFIDDQLNAVEKAEILEALSHDSELNKRVYDLQKLQNLVQLSYESIAIPDKYQANNNSQSTRFRWLAAASFLLVIGSAAGWLSHDALNQNLSDFAQISTQNVTNTSDNWKVLMHVSTANPTRLNIVLNEAEALLKEYAKSSKKLQLEILTNSKGMTLVTDNNKQFSNRLKSLQNQYDNLVVMACGETLKRIRSKQKDIQLLPNTNVVSSALNQVVKRQKDGWAYIRI